MHAIPFVCVLAAAVPVLLPSDPAAVYAVIDKVVLLPDAQQPTQVELHGAFALAEGRNGSYYQAPRAGVLRFAAGTEVEDCRKQWRELSRLAGSNTVVTFGARYELCADGAPRPRIDTVEAPVVEVPKWSVGFGMNALQQVDYGPPRELSLLPRCLPVDLGTQKGHPHWPERTVVFACTSCTAEDADLRYVFCVESSDGDRVASGLLASTKGPITWTAQLALQVGETITWSVHVVGSKVERAPIARDRFVVPAAAVERQD